MIIIRRSGVYVPPGNRNAYSKMEALLEKLLKGSKI